MIAYAGGPVKTDAGGVRRFLGFDIQIKKNLHMVCDKADRN